MPQERFEPEGFENLDFNADERAFLEYLAERNKAFDYLIILLGLAEAASAPKTPDELGAALITQVTVKSPSWADAAQGARNIVAGAAARDVQYFYQGAHQEFPGKKPQGLNKAFFRKLEQHYVSMIGS